MFRFLFATALLMANSYAADAPVAALVLVTKQYRIPSELLGTNWHEDCVKAKITWPGESSGTYLAHGSRYILCNTEANHRIVQAALDDWIKRARAANASPAIKATISYLRGDDLLTSLLASQSA